MSAERLNLLWGITMASGATAQLVAKLTSLQAVVLLLVRGLVVGRAGFHWVEPLDLGSSLGTVVGLPMALLTGRIRSGTPTLEEAIAVVLIIAGAADALGVSQILAAMVAGCLIANLASHHERPFSEIENIEQPFLVIFFLLAGASFAFDALGQTGLIGVAYIALRTLGKIAGGWLGGMRAGLTGREAGWFGAALLPQAGVALGLALVAAERLPDSAAILNTVILATIVFELTGPIVTRVAIGRVARGDVAHTRLLPPRKQRQRWLPKRVRGDKTR